MSALFTQIIFFLGTQNNLSLSILRSIFDPTRLQKYITKQITTTKTKNRKDKISVIFAYKILSCNNLFLMHGLRDRRDY